MYEIKSSMGAVIGLLIAIVAITGTQVLGWEWGDGRLLPTIIGVVVCGIAVVFVGRSLQED